MATVFERLIKIQKENNWRQLTLDEKKKLGSIVVSKFLQNGYQKNQAALYQSVEDTGIYQVINYPNTFTRAIDALIVWYYDVEILKTRKYIPRKVKQSRTRIPTRPLKIHSEKAIK